MAGYRTMNILTQLAIIGAIGATHLAAGKDADLSKLPPTSTQRDVTYAQDIKPILDKTCIRCHGGEKPKAKLRLDSLEGVLKGSHDGKVVEPGNIAGSRLLLAAGHVGKPDDYMPPVKNRLGILPLTPEQVGLIRAWIEQGAK
jgi:hypothetical protein